MAYLPTINETSESSTESIKDSAGNILKSIKGRFDFANLSPKFAVNPVVENSISATKESGLNVNILNKLYEFIVKDSYMRDKSDSLMRKEKEIVEKEDTERELNIIKYSAVEGEVQENEKEGDKQGLISKLFGYYSTYKMGKFAYDHWAQIEKFFGIEGLADSIRKIGHELGIDTIISKIQKTVGDIMKGFSLTPETPTTPDVGTTNNSNVKPQGFNKPEFISHLNKLEKERGLSEGTLGGIMMQESSGMNKGYHYAEGATNPKMSDFGLFGIKKDYTGKTPGYGIKPLQDTSPEEQARFAADYVAEMKKRTGSEEGGIAAFHTGLGGWKKTGKGGGEEYVGFIKEKKKWLVKGGQSTTPATESISKIFPATETATRVPKQGGSPMDLAQSFLGKSESNSADELNSFIGKNFGPFNIKKDKWCAAFVNSALVASGYKGTGSAAAKSFLTLPGIVYDRLTQKGNIQDAQPGDIAIFQRSSGGHVGFVKSVDMSGITILGGNQSDKNSGGQVSIVKKKFDDLLGIRRPGEFNKPTLLAKTTIQPPEQVAGETTTEQPKPNFLQQAVNEYKSVGSFLKPFVESATDPEASKRLESQIMEMTRNIPLKEKFIPNIGELVKQTNVIINSSELKRNLNGTVYTPEMDMPAMFINQGISNG